MLSSAPTRPTGASRSSPSRPSNGCAIPTRPRSPSSSRTSSRAAAWERACWSSSPHSRHRRASSASWPTCSPGTRRCCTSSPRQASKKRSVATATRSGSSCAWPRRPAYFDRRDERDHVAVAESLRPFFAPSSVAVVGASPKPGSIGGSLVRNIRASGFPGALYPINRGGVAVDGDGRIRVVRGSARTRRPRVRLRPRGRSARRRRVRASTRDACDLRDLGRLCRARPRGRSPPGRAARARPCPRRTPTRAELRRHRARRPAAQRHVRRGPVSRRGTSRSARRAARSASRSSTRRAGAGSDSPRSSPSGTRRTSRRTTSSEYWEDDEQHGRRDPVPRVLRKSAPVQPDRPPRRPPQADPRPQGRDDRGRTTSGRVPHRGACRLRRCRRGAVSPGRRDPGADFRGARGHGRRASRPNRCRLGTESLCSRTPAGSRSSAPMPARRRVSRLHRPRRRRATAFATCSRPRRAWTARSTCSAAAPPSSTASRSTSSSRIKVWTQSSSSRFLTASLPMTDLEPILEASRRCKARAWRSGSTPDPEEPDSAVRLSRARRPGARPRVAAGARGSSGRPARRSSRPGIDRRRAAAVVEDGACPKRGHVAHPCRGARSC